MKTERLNKILAAMDEKSIPQLLISDPAVIYYLTGVRLGCGERMVTMLIRQDGQHCLVLNELFPQSPEAQEALGMPIVWFNDIQDGVALLYEHILPGQPIAIDKNWPARFLLRLQELNPDSRYTNSSSIIDYVRMIKGTDEQEKMIRASITNDRVMGRIIAEVNKGYDELELDALLRKFYIEEGCTDVSFDPITAYGKNAADPHHVTDHTKGQPGDCVVLDIGGLQDDYCSDMTRTVFIGSVSDRQREIYNIVKEANLRGIAAAKPGNRMCDVDNAARSYIEEMGYGKYFTHRTGHSIGLEVHEFGDVSAANTDIIRPGQCFSVEPGIYLPDENLGVRIEDLVLITEVGCKVLNSFTKDIIVV